MSAVSKQVLTISVLIAGAGGLVVGGLGGCVAGYQVGKGGGLPADKKVYSREEFRSLVMGKTPDEVTKVLGKPVSTSDKGDGQPTWYYENLSRDPASGRLDSWIAVRFANGVVVSVSF